jgi:hypothetical protein
MTFDSNSDDDMNELVRITKREPDNTTNIQIQVVLGDSHRVKEVVTVPMSRELSGWYGDWEGHIEGQYVAVSVHLPIGGLFDVQE